MTQTLSPGVVTFGGWPSGSSWSKLICMAVLPFSFTVPSALKGSRRSLVVMDHVGFVVGGAGPSPGPIQISICACVSAFDLFGGAASTTSMPWIVSG